MPVCCNRKNQGCGKHKVSCVMKVCFSCQGIIGREEPAVYFPGGDYATLFLHTRCAVDLGTELIQEGGSEQKRYDQIVRKRVMRRDKERA